MIDSEVFTSLIKGLEYHKRTGLFSFKRKRYRLKQVAHTLKKDSDSISYFINIDNAKDIRKVIIRNGIVYFDDFNKIKIDLKERRVQYFQKYYQTKTRVNKFVESRKFFREKSNQLKSLIKKDIQEEQIEREPRYCQKCGKKFEPLSANQKFCCIECRLLHYRDIQLKEKSQSNKMIKECPICKVKFEGNKREVYCSSKCKRISRSIKNKKGRNIEKEKD